MAATISLFVLVAATAFASSVQVDAAIHTVGGDAGWTTNVDYKKWAATQTFVSGDVLLFKYDLSRHTVYLVSEADYETCNSSKPLYVFAPGQTLFSLDQDGSWYFICPLLNHCNEGGMRLAVKTAQNTGNGDCGSNNSTMGAWFDTPSSTSECNHGVGALLLNKLSYSIIGFAAWKLAWDLW